MVAILDVELATYKSHLPALLACAENRWVAIRGTSVVGVYHTREAAVEAGFNASGGGPFLSMRISRARPAAGMSPPQAPRFIAPSSATSTS